MKKILIILIVLMFIIYNNCGYRLAGHGKQIPDHIKTIVIPDFENKTTRIEAEQFVTFAVKEEFVRRSDLVLVSSRSEADSLLEGEIISFNVVPVSITKEGSANLYRLKIVINIRFIDLKKNKVIFEGLNIGFTDTYDVDDINEEDFFSQETEKLLEIADQFAESVVITILENF